MGFATGTFLAEVLGATITKSPTKGTEQVALEFKLLEGPNVGSRVTHYAALTDARLPYTVKELRTCGWRGDDLADLSDLGGEVELVLAEETYNDVVRTKVKFVNSAGSRTKQADNVPAIADRWRAKIAALPKEDADPFGS